jgi:hypothetical protein
VNSNTIQSLPEQDATERPAAAFFIDPDLVVNDIHQFTEQFYAQNSLLFFKSYGVVSQLAHETSTDTLKLDASGAEHGNFTWQVVEAVTQGQEAKSYQKDNHYDIRIRDLVLGPQSVTGHEYILSRQLQLVHEKPMEPKLIHKTHGKIAGVLCHPDTQVEIQRKYNHKAHAREQIAKLIMSLGINVDNPEEIESMHRVDRQNHERLTYLAQSIGFSILPLYKPPQ